jgi:septal ring factor EnvC (AmiA/AmiB activator)
METIRPEENNARRNKKEGRRGVGLAVPLLVLLWLALVGGGVWLARDYIDNSLRDIQDTNALHVQALQDKLESLSQKLDELEMALEAADDSIARSSTTQEELNERIVELDRQLEKLEESLRILKESNDAALD